eukprot:scaffold610868_cov14-Prasinocladus_malaysianus.AAC.1
MNARTTRDASGYYNKDLVRYQRTQRRRFLGLKVLALVRLPKTVEPSRCWLNLLSEALPEQAFMSHV